MRVSARRFAAINTARTTGALAHVYEQRQGYNETNDCTVISMSVAFGIPYNVAHDILAAAGRQNGKGFYFQTYLRGLAASGTSVCGYKITGVRCDSLPVASRNYLRATRYAYPSLGKVQRDFPKGRFILIKRGHAFTMLDGKVIDNNAATTTTQITYLFLLERA